MAFKNSSPKEITITEQQEHRIINDYNSGIKRNVIIRKNKITDWQFVSIIKKAIDNAKTKPIQVARKPFRLNG